MSRWFNFFLNSQHAVWCCLLSMPVWSQTTLDPTHTRASTLETPGKIVLDRTLFEGRYQSLSDFFATLNGIQTMPTGGLGDPVLVSIQGASSKQTTLLVNGIKVNSSLYGAYDLNVVPIHQIEEIHIITSGSRDAVSSAIGGTINIITKQHDLSTLSANYGSFNTYQVAGSLQSPKSMLLHVQHLSSDNNYSYPVPINSQGLQNQYEPLKNSDYNESTFRLSAQNTHVNWSVSGEKNKKNIPDYFRNSSVNDAYLKRNAIDINLRKTLKASPQQWQHEVQASYARKNEFYKDLNSTIGLDKNNDTYATRDGVLQFSSRKFSDEWLAYISATYGIQDFQAQYKADEDSYDCTTPNGQCDLIAKQSRFELASSLSWNHPQKTLELTQQIFSAFNTNKTEQRNGSNTEYEESQFVGFLTQITSHHSHSQHSLSVSKKTRLPSLHELFGDRGLVLSNEDLKPETSRTLSLQSTWHNFFNQSLKTELFYRQLENAIIPIYDTRGVGRYENTSQADIYGLEWQFQSLVIDGLSLGLSGSHYQSENKSRNILSFNGKQLASLYHHTLKSSLNYRIDRHSVNFQYEYATEIYKDHSNLEQLDDKSLLSTFYEFVLPQTQFGVRVHNLLNSEFIDASGRPSIGRSFTVYLQHQF